jgi:ribosomal protein S27AE
MEFSKCPKCKSRVLFKDIDRTECGNCGLVLTDNCCYTKLGDKADEQVVNETIKKKRN